ncbi:TIM-barrel domain-containing protein [Glaciecola sp. SC05]|uniref:glycoside hydrolase family 31 protein n=1 Tax=Glaciecola sp. SC05 TaxID=1987355 RepID=UPI0035287FE2
MRSNTRSAFVSFILCLGILPFSAQASEAVSINSLELLENTLEIDTTAGHVSISALNHESVEVFYQPYGLSQLPSFALPEDTQLPSKNEFTTELTEHTSGYRFKLPELDVLIQSAPFKLSFMKGDKLLAEEEVGLFVYDTLRGFRFALQDDEVILGGGQRVLGMDRRGHRMPLYNKAHYGYTTESNQMYYSLPAVMSSKHYIIAFDNTASGFLDIGHTEQDVLQFEAAAGRTSYIFSAGDNAQDVVQNFVSVTGKQPLPPRWALGNYASRFGYRSQQETLDTIDKFIAQDFPVDAVILDLFWFGPDIKGHMGNLNWDKITFPEPEKMIAELKSKGVNTILITEPFILTSSSQWDSAVEHKALAKNLAFEPRTFDFYFGNTGLVDVFDEEAQDWFWEYYAKLNEQGVAGWWGDLGEPEVHPADSLHRLNEQYVSADEIHNAYGHKWAQMVYERQLKMRPTERPFVMMRSGFIGSQRYGMIPWTGDVDRSWGGLKPQVELALQMSLFGLAYIHSDLGGFAGGEVFDAELYTRWMQYGVFQPVYRPHAQEHIPPEPVFHDEATQALVRPFVKLRYQMLPYNYSLSMQNSLYGTPMMRPLFFAFEDADINRSDAYMWGDAMLVSPVVSAGVKAQDIELPDGIWFNFFGDANQTRAQYYQGGQIVSVPTPAQEIPVLVKAGAFIPMVDAMQNTQAYSTEVLHVHHYSHDSVGASTYTLYEDDGKDPNSIRDDAFQTLSFQSQRNAESLNITASVQGQYNNAPMKRRILLSIHGLQSAPTSIKINDLSYSPVDDQSILALSNGAYWDTQSQQLMVSGVLQKDMTVGLDLAQ